MSKFPQGSRNQYSSGGAGFQDSFRKLRRRWRSLLKLVRQRKGNPWIQGEFIVLKNKVGTDIYEEVYKENVVVDGASVLAARLFKDPTEPATGLFCCAVGVGDNSWNLSSPPAAVGTETALVGELARATVLVSKFITPVLGTVSVTPTNIVDFEFVFPDGVAVGPWMEVGLWGGDATLTLNTGTLLTYKTFPVIHKSADWDFKIIYRLTF